MKIKAKYFIFSGLIITILCLFISFIFTLLIVNDVLTSDIGLLLTKIFGAISFLIGGLYLGKKIKSKGYLIGIISILIYLFFVLCFSLTKLNISTVDVVIRCITLYIGSIIGVNLTNN